MLLADTAEFGSQYGHSADWLLSDAMWACSNMFATAYVITHTVAHVRVTVFLLHCNPVHYIHSIESPAVVFHSETSYKQVVFTVIDIVRIVTRVWLS